MKHNVALTITSLLLVLLLTFHLTDDIVRGFEPGTLRMLNAVPLVVIWLYAALMLAGRRSGYIIVLLFSLLSIGVPIIHMMGRGVGVHSRIGYSHGAFFFVWTLIAIGVIGLFSAVVSAHALWNLSWRRSSGSNIQT
jgi:hypothetical protein